VAIDISPATSLNGLLMIEPLLIESGTPSAVVTG
jgi:hypothetical protein